MPRYHFHVQTAVQARDEEGQDLPDLDAAKASAMKGVRFLMIEEMRCEHRFSPNHAIKITDSDGAVLHTTRYGDCVDVRL